MDYSEFGFVILKYRRRNKIAQADFAKQVGISRNYVSIIERGEAQNVSVRVLVDLANRMEMDACELLGILMGEVE